MPVPTSLEKPGYWRGRMGSLLGSHLLTGQQSSHPNPLPLMDTAWCLSSKVTSAPSGTLSYTPILLKAPARVSEPSNRTGQLSPPPEAAGSALENRPRAGQLRTLTRPLGFSIPALFSSGATFAPTSVGLRLALRRRASPARFAPDSWRVKSWRH